MSNVCTFTQQMFAVCPANSIFSSRRVKHAYPGTDRINLTLHYNSEQYMNSNRINLCGSIIIYVYMWSCPDQERVGNIEGKKKTMRKTGCRCISFDTISPQMV